MRFRLFLLLILSLLFVLGQQGAIAHSVSHLASSQEQQQDKSGHTPVCDQCQAYAKLGHALQAITFAPPDIAQTHAAPSRHLPQNHTTKQPEFYAARGPPEHS